MPSSSPFQVIALISGGKDSIFSLLHLQSLGHTIVALANLSPPTLSPPSSADDAHFPDLNSYMYQTAGAALIPHFSSLLGIPLHRQPITGTAVNTEKEYSRPWKKTEGGAADVEDETEALLPLLRLVMSHHPEANALSSGAILSTYQRTRLESIALRLGLVPFAPLWQYPVLPSPYASALKPSSLLLDMRAAELQARIVKVASGGLDEDLLWENLMDERVRKRVERGVKRFGGGGGNEAVLGEGGEFETVVTGGRWGEIDVGEEGRTIRRGEGGEAWIEIKGEAGRVRPAELEREGKWNGVREIGLWDEGWEEMAVDTVDGATCSEEIAQTKRPEPEGVEWSVERSVLHGHKVISISNLTCPGSQGDVQAQTTKINSSIVSVLKECDRSTGDIVFATILLRSMSDFAAVNSVYGTLFTRPNPPARVTIAAGDALPRGIDMMLSLTVDGNLREKRSGLHVQSRSYWAPANIGPYSQAISVPLNDHEATIFIAGQIPLVPISMEVLAMDEDVAAADGNALSAFSRRATLSLQHLWRIGREMDVSWWTGSIAFLAGKGSCHERAKVAWNLWTKVHERPDEISSEDEDGEDGPDAWDLRYGGHGFHTTAAAEEHKLPDFRALETAPPDHTPGFFAVQVDELPRGCDVEWQSLGLASKSVRVRASSHRDEIFVQTCETGSGSLAVRFVEFLISEELDLGSFQRGLQHGIGGRMQRDSRLGMHEGPHITIYTPRPDVFAYEGAQVVPCRRIWGREGRELGVGVVVRWM